MAARSTIWKRRHPISDPLTVRMVMVDNGMQKLHAEAYGQTRNLAPMR
jgi:hypothetical protein